MKKLFIFLIIILGMHSSIWPMEEERPKITITTSDESVFEIDPTLQDLISKYSQTINDVLSEALEKKEEEIAIAKQLLEEGKEVEPVEPIAIPLLTISPENFGFVLSALKNHHVKHVNEEITHEELVERLQEDLTNLSANQLIDMIQTANYLDMQYLLQAATEVFAKKVYTELIDRFSSKEGYIELKSLLAQLPIEIQRIMTFGPLGIIKFAPESWSNLIKKFQSFEELPVGKHKLWVWNPDGAKLALVEKNSTIIWDSRTNKEIAKIDGDFHKIYWSPNGTKLALIGKDGVIIWNSVTKENMSESGIFSEVFWSPNSEKIALSGSKKTIIWDLINNIKIDQLDNFYGKGWNLDSVKLILQAEDKVILWNTKTKEKIDEIKGKFYGVFVSPDNTKLILLEPGNAVIWNVITDEKTKIPEIDKKEVNYKVFWSPDGAKFALQGPDKVIIWNTKTNKKITEIKDNFNVVFWSPDGSKFALQGPDKVIIWNTKTNEKITEIDSVLVPVKWSSDSDKVALNRKDWLIVWDSQTNKITNIAKIDKTVFAIFFSWSPDGTKLAVATPKMIIWDSLVNAKIAEEGGIFTYIFWSSDNTKIALQKWSRGEFKSIIWKFDPIFMKEMQSLNLLQTLFIVWLDKENITKKDAIPEYLQELFVSLPWRIKGKIIRR